MGIFKRKDSPNWWYRIQFDRKVVTATTHTKDKRLAYRIYLEKLRCSQKFGPGAKVVK